MENLVHNPNSLNLITFTPSLGIVHRDILLDTFIEMNKDIVKKQTKPIHLEVLFFDGYENRVLTTESPEIEINGHMLQFDYEEKGGHTYYISSMDIHIKDIIAIDLNKQS